MDLTVIGKKQKAASRILGRLNVEEKNKGLKAAADALKAEDNIEKILAANKEDIENAKNNNMKASLIDRLALDKDRINAMAYGLFTDCRAS